MSSQAGANALPVAEYTLAMILLATKGIPRARDRYWAVRGGVDVGTGAAGDKGMGHTAS